MIVLIILTYLGLVYAAFRIFKIPLKPITLSIALLIGVGVVAGILASWQGGAPVSKQITLTRNIIEISSQLKGFITKVNYGVGEPVKAGELVWQIDPEPYEAALASAQAQVQAATSQVGVAEAAVKVATANIARSEANAATAQTERDRADKLFASGSSAISELQVEQLRNASNSANAAVEQALASKDQALAGLEAAQRNVSVAEESVRTAEFNLSLTDWEAPTDGVLINWQAREKTITTALRASAIGTFMEIGNSRVIAVLPQNLMRKVNPGDTAELAFMSRPGQIDTGKVLRIANYTGEGQIIGGQQVPQAHAIGSKGFIAAVIQLDDAALAEALSLGEAGAAAIYSADPGPFGVVSKIYIRMLSLMFFLP